MGTADQAGSAPGAGGAGGAASAAAGKPTTYSAFISHASEDFERADEVRASLEERGFDPYGSRQAHGMIIKGPDAPDGAKAPLLFAHYEPGLDKDQLVVTPDCPRDVELIEWSTLENGGFRELERTGFNRGNKNFFRFEIPATNKTVRLAMIDAQGRKRGPFTYDTTPLHALRLTTYKADFVKRMRHAIVCKRLRFTLPVPAPAADAPQDAAALQFARMRSLDAILMRERLAFVKEAPAIVCASNDGLFRGENPSAGEPPHLHSWCAVKEVHLGATKEKQDKVVPVLLTADRLDDHKALPDGFAWHATMPADAKEVYAKFVFRDGEESRPLLLDIEDVKGPDGDAHPRGGRGQ